MEDSKEPFISERVAVSMAIAALIGEEKRSAQRGELAGAIMCREAWVLLNKLAKSRGVESYAVQLAHQMSRNDASPRGLADTPE
jgi:hypothetical protein